MALAIPTEKAPSSANSVAASQQHAARSRTFSIQWLVRITPVIKDIADLIFPISIRLLSVYATALRPSPVKMGSTAPDAPSWSWKELFHSAQLCIRLDVDHYDLVIQVARDNDRYHDTDAPTEYVLPIPKIARMFIIPTHRLLRLDDDEKEDESKMCLLLQIVKQDDMFDYFAVEVLDAPHSQATLPSTRSTARRTVTESALSAADICSLIEMIVRAQDPFAE
jgi:hypothetical protein